MYTIQPKKLLIMNILDILRKYTDCDHRLSQKEIIDILRKEYNMTADRKAVKRNLMNLIDFGYDIDYSESIRINRRKNEDGEYEEVEETIYTDWYLEREFSNAELRLLIDGLLFSKHVPYAQCKELVEKIEGLSNIYFRSRVKHIKSLPDSSPQNKQLFYIIETLDEAISKNKQVSFTYNYYGTDKKMHPKTYKSGHHKEYIINPYQMVATNGRYYLICNIDCFDDVINLRLDRITDIKLLDSVAKDTKKVSGLEHGFNLPKHMAEHIYMFSGESERVTFKAKKYIVTDIIDWFGIDVEFRDETDDDVTVSVIVNIESMKNWAVQYSPHVKVLSPQKLIDGIKEDLKLAFKNYGM